MTQCVEVLDDLLAALRELGSLIALVRGRRQPNFLLGLISCFLEQVTLQLNKLRVLHGLLSAVFLGRCTFESDL